MTIILRYVDVSFLITSLPMHKTTTSTNNQKDVMTSVKGPKKATIELLKQFARVYEYNVELPRGLESMILN